MADGSPPGWIAAMMREYAQQADQHLSMPISGTFIEAYREVTDKIGPRHRLANRWHFDLRWEFAPGVMAKWLTPEIRHGR